MKKKRYFISHKEFSIFAALKIELGFYICFTISVENIRINRIILAIKIGDTHCRVKPGKFSEQLIAKDQ